MFHGFIGCIQLLLYKKIGSIFRRVVMIYNYKNKETSLRYAVVGGKILMYGFKMPNDMSIFITLKLFLRCSR